MVPVKSSAPAVTELLRAVEAGNAGARDALQHAVDTELRSMTRRTLAGTRARGVVSPTELVQGVALKLMVQQRLAARDRARFIACSVPRVRQVLMAHMLHDAPAQPRSVEHVVLVSKLAEEPDAQISFSALHAALDRLAVVSAEQARLVELRYFGGMSIEEIALLDDTPVDTVRCSWQAARAWLREVLGR